MNFRCSTVQQLIFPRWLAITWIVKSHGWIKKDFCVIFCLFDKIISQRESHQKEDFKCCTVKYNSSYSLGGGRLHGLRNRSRALKRGSSNALFAPSGTSGGLDIKQTNLHRREQFLIKHVFDVILSMDSYIHSSYKSEIKTSQ